MSGSGFLHEDLCLINQVDGGDEWLTIRHGIAFESIAFGAVGRQGDHGAVTQLLARLLRASLEECKDLAY